MKLALDIGNTRTKLGWFSDGGVPSVESVPTEALLARLGDMEHRGLTGISSVVPSVAAEAAAILAAGTGRPPFVVSHRAVLPFAMAYTTPETLGNDRIAAAAAALDYAEPSTPVIAVDAGTAVTYEVVTGDRVYRGGAIAPGPGLVRSALHLGTAQLPQFEEFEQASAVGDSTIAAIQSGVQWGFVDAVAGMIVRLQSQLGGNALVVGTGGWSPFLAARGVRFDVLDPHLVLRGVLALMNLNQES